MTKANFIWVFGLFSAIAIITFQFTFGAVRQQDLSRSTRVRNDCYSMVEQYALDAIEKYLNTQFKMEGVALIQTGKEGELKSYVEDQMAKWDVIKSDVENLTLTNVTVEPGSYHTAPSGSGNGVKMKQDKNELPRYKAKLSGDIKRLVKYAGDSPTIHFTIDINVVAQHIGVESGYIQ